LKRRSAFVAAAKGLRRREAFFTLQLGRPPDRIGRPPRIGLTATRKIGNAVERNRIRRRLREAVRAVWPPADAEGHDFVIIAKREILTAPFDQLARDLERAMLTLRRSDKKSDRSRPGAVVDPSARSAVRTSHQVTS
jgi:ribonuclease P protein component